MECEGHESREALGGTHTAVPGAVLGFSPVPIVVHLPMVEMCAVVPWAAV